MPDSQQNDVSVSGTQNNMNQGLPPEYQPTQEEIERTMKIMHSSLSQRKKGFFDTVKEWFS